MKVFLSGNIWGDGYGFRQAVVVAESAEQAAQIVNAEVEASRFSGWSHYNLVSASDMIEVSTQSAGIADLSGYVE